MPANVADHLAATGGVSYVNCLLQVKLVDERGQIVRISVQIVAVPRLTRPAVAAAVVRNAAVPARGEEKHLIFEGIG